MKRKDIVIGIVIIALVVLTVRWLRSRNDTSLTDSLNQLNQLEEDLESSFNIDIPEDVDKASLKDQVGGIASGIATRKYEQGTFTLNIIADLPDPEASERYQGWLVKNGEEMLLGSLSIAKGGYLLEYQSVEDLTDYGKVVVSQETQLDSVSERVVLQGEFE